MLYFHNSLPARKYKNLLLTQQKAFSFWGGVRLPDPLTRGSAPGLRWGHRPQTSDSPQCLLYGENWLQIIRHSGSGTIICCTKFGNCFDCLPLNAIMFVVVSISVYIMLANSCYEYFIV